MISGPSGVGKTTVVSELRARGSYRFSVSATTRAPRPAELEGVDYHFVTRDQFSQMREAGELLEWAEYGGNWYGTPRSEMQSDAEGDILLDIEVHGAMQVKDAFPDAVTIFIAPPDLETLETRLRSRGDTANAEERLRIARWQLEVSRQHFDHVVVNDDVATAVDQIERILAPR